MLCFAILWPCVWRPPRRSFSPEEGIIGEVFREVSPSGKLTFPSLKMEKQFHDFIAPFLSLTKKNEVFLYWGGGVSIYKIN